MLRVFFALLLPALLVKGAMVLVDLRDAAALEWTVQLLGRAAFLLWGQELWASLAIATICATALFAVGRGRPRGYAITATVVDVIVLSHAVFGALAFAYFEQEGEFATCHLARMIEGQSDHQGLWASMYAALTPAALAVLALSLLAAWWGCRHAAGRVMAWRVRAQRALALVLVGEALVAALLVPALLRGELPIRFKSHGLERSPVLRLASSCVELPLARALRRDHALARDADFGPGLASNAATQRPAWGGAPQRTNVVIVLAESVMDPVAFGQLAAMPHTARRLEDPKVLRLGEHYATWSLTTQSTFSILSGEHPSPLYAPVVGRKPGLELETLPEALHAGGYATWFVSSQDLSFDRQRRFYERHGFDRIADQGDQARALELGGQGHTTWNAGWGVDDRVTVATAFDWIDAHQSQQRFLPSGVPQPFFLVVQTAAAHHPYELPDDVDLPPLPVDAKRPEKYARALSFVDQQIESVFAGLEARGLDENTLVLVVSDHGEGWGRNKGRNVAEPNLRSLAFMRGPQVPAGSSPLGPTSHVDLAPTLLSLVGIEAPCTMRGRDLSQGGPAHVQWFAGRPPKSQRGLRDGRWRFVLEDGEARLYDLGTLGWASPGSHDLVDEPPFDPAGELPGRASIDVASEHPQRVARYRQALEAWEANARWRFDHARAMRAQCERKER